MTDAEAIELIKLVGFADYDIYGPLMPPNGGGIQARWVRGSVLTNEAKNMIKLVNIVEERVLARKR